MIGQGKGDWFICARCGHLAMPGNPHFLCTCAHCVRLEQPTERMRNRKGHRKTASSYVLLKSREGVGAYARQASEMISRRSEQL
jgi:hypothetical protein